MTLLESPDRHPVRRDVRPFGAVVVLAPHPDDESLGCGGLLALLAQARMRPRVVVVTDGSRSHDSPSTPPAALAALRQREALAAVAALGLEPDALSFLGHPDCGMPEPGTPAFDRAAVDLAGALSDADTVLVPWRRDPHRDHQATWELARAAVASLDRPVRWIEYPVWAWEHAATDAAPQPGEAEPWRLPVGEVLDRKRRAIAAHRSQTTRMIDDDPDGFVLAPQMLAHFDRPWELYLDA